MFNTASAAVIGATLLTVAAQAQSGTSQSPSSQSIQIQLSQSLPSQHSDYIDPSFAGFGIEPSNLFSFTGAEESNDLTFNLIANLANYTGVPPHIRIGGNTQDYMVYSEDQDQYTWILNPNVTILPGQLPPDHMLIGPKFFEVANRFPYGTPMTWGLNLAYDQADYKELLTTMATQAATKLTNIKLVSFEIGNEPDLYAQNGFRTGVPWGGDVYTAEWLDRADTIWEEVIKSKNVSSRFFEPGATASTIGTSFTIADLTTLGISKQANESNTSYVASWNQHDYYYYIGVTKSGLDLEEFMTLQTTNTQFAAWQAQVAEAELTPYPYALREMCSAGPIGIQGITDTFGGALWTLNFFLFTATLNISTVQMHMTDNSNASAWMPLAMDNQEPHVRPNYYGYAAFDQIIGPSCQAQVSNLDIGEQDKIKAYSVYQAGNLSSIVVINGNLANTTDTDKANLTVSVSLPTSLAGQELHLAFLTSDGADATNGTTWNGISYEKSGNGKPTVVDDADRTIMVGQDGNVTFMVRDSQAVAANVVSKVGSGTANKSACAAIASRSQAIGPTPIPTSGPPPTGTAAPSATGDGGDGVQRAAPSGGAKGEGVRMSAVVFGTWSIAAIAGGLLLF